MRRQECLEQRQDLARLNVDLKTDGMLIEPIRSKSSFDIERSRRVQLPVQGVFDRVEFCDVSEVWGNARHIDAAKRHLDSFLAIGVQEPMPQNPVTLHLPGEFSDVAGE